MNPNHYLAVAIAYLFAAAHDGARTLQSARPLSSAMIDRVATSLERKLIEARSASSGSSTG